MNLGIASAELQKLQFAAKQAGVESGSFNNAIAKMSRTVADAAAGSDEAEKALKGLGLSAQHLKSLSPDQQLRLVADAMKGITNPTERISKAFKIFGRSGVQMIAFLDGGSRGLENAAKRAKELGFNLTELDVQLGDLGADALGELGASLDNLWKQFVVELAPAVTVLAESLAAMIGSFAQGTDETYALSRSVLTFVGNAIDGFNNISAAIMKIIANLADALGRIEDFFDADDFKSPLSELADTWRAEANRIENVEMDQVFLERMAEVIKRAQDAVARRDELARGAAGVGELDGTGNKKVEPAAVEQGTAAYIEAINKGASNPQKEMVREQQKANVQLRRVNDGLDELAREFRNNRLATANLG